MIAMTITFCKIKVKKIVLLNIMELNEVNLMKYLSVQHNTQGEATLVFR